MLILFGGEKGGTGKSTLSTNIAALRAAAGRDVLLVDTDYPQLSVTGWQAVRLEVEPALPRVHCVQKTGKTLAAELRDLAQRYDDIVVDAGGRDSVELRSALTVCDVAVLPVQPSQFDVWTVSRVHELLEQAAAFNPEMRAMVVVSRASTHASNTDGEDVTGLVSDYPGLEVAKTVIRDRIAYRRAAGAGMSVIELEKDANGKASQEIQGLYAEVFGAPSAA